MTVTTVSSTWAHSTSTELTAVIADGEYMFLVENRNCTNSSACKYAHPVEAFDKGVSQEEAKKMNEIKEIWLKRFFYGYRRITKELQAIGHDANRKCVLRLMQNMGL